MKINFENGSTIESIDAKEHLKRSFGKSIILHPLTLAYVRRYYCPNCRNWHGDNHDYECKSCKICMKRIEWS